MHATKPRVGWNRTLMRADQAAKGWNDVALAAACRWPKKTGAEARVHQTSISRFMSGDSNSPRLAKVIATALGQKVSRYVVVIEESAPSSVGA